MVYVRARGVWDHVKVWVRAGGGVPGCGRRHKCARGKTYIRASAAVHIPARY